MWFQLYSAYSFNIFKKAMERCLRPAETLCLPNGPPCHVERWTPVWAPHVKWCVKWALLTSPPASCSVLGWGRLTAVDSLSWHCQLDHTVFSLLSHAARLCISFLSLTRGEGPHVEVKWKRSAPCPPFEVNLRWLGTGTICFVEQASTVHTFSAVTELLW